MIKEEKINQAINKEYAKKLILHDPLREVEKFFDRFPDLLWDDPEDEFNELIGILRSKAMDYYRIWTNHTTIFQKQA